MELKPLWIVQNNLGSTGNFETMKEYASKTGIPFKGVKIRPFTDDVPEDVDGPVVVYGSCGMIRAARKTALARGIFENEQGFKFKALREAYGEHLLNYDAHTVSVGQFCKEWRGGFGEIFIRGNDDEKHIIGHKTTWKEFSNDIDNRPSISENYEIIVSDVKQIRREFRVFIVNGKAVAGSSYGGFNNKLDDGYIRSGACLAEAMYFAQFMAKRYSPHSIYVMDVCDTPEGNKIVELNGFNSAGFYSADIPAIMDAVNKSLLGV